MKGMCHSHGKRLEATEEETCNRLRAWRIKSKNEPMPMLIGLPQAIIAKAYNACLENQLQLDLHQYRVACVNFRAIAERVLSK